jgi:hypothetical protein
VPDDDPGQSLQAFISEVVNCGHDDEYLWKRASESWAKDNPDDPDDWDAEAVPTAIEYHSSPGT